MWTWLVDEWQWPAAGLFAAAFLLVLFPIFLQLAGLPLALVYLQLPVYMLHQAEEHLGDRFRRHVNLTVAQGHEALTPWVTFLINSLGVWAYDLVSLFLAWKVWPPLGVAAGYLAVVNGIAHLLQAIARREPNPGLFTGAGLLLPVGALGIACSSVPQNWIAHALGCAAALAVHAAIVIHVDRRATLLQTASRTASASPPAPPPPA